MWVKLPQNLPIWHPFSVIPLSTTWSLIFKLWICVYIYLGCWLLCEINAHGTKDLIFKHTKVGTFTPWLKLASTYKPQRHLQVKRKHCIHVTPLSDVLLQTSKEKEKTKQNPTTCLQKSYQKTVFYSIQWMLQHKRSFWLVNFHWNHLSPRLKTCIVFIFCDIYTSQYLTFAEQLNSMFCIPYELLYWWCSRSPI